MSDNLVIDTEVLSNARRALGSIASEFVGDDIIASNLGQAVGHADLAAKVDHFSGMWRIRRARIEKDIEALDSMLDATIQGFEGSERALTNSLSGAQQ